MTSPLPPPRPEPQVIVDGSPGTAAGSPRASSPTSPRHSSGSAPRTSHWGPRPARSPSASCSARPKGRHGDRDHLPPLPALDRQRPAGGIVMTDEIFSRVVPGGQVVIEMTGWDGRSSAPKFLSDWPSALEFLGSPGFRLMGGIRRLTVHDTGRPAPTLAQARAIAERGQRDLTCGAAPGEPCTGAPDGRLVHGNRWVAAARAARAERRGARVTPEARAALTRLPRIPAEEIEACRLPAGGYSFTEPWFRKHGLPYPPIAGWLKAVTRPEDTDIQEDGRPWP